MNKFFVLIALALLFTHCKKDKTKLDDAELIGLDLRKCMYPYCGGFWITLNQDTLRFLNFPENSDVEEPTYETEFPIAVKIQWELPKEEDLQKIKDLIVLKKIIKR